MRISYNKCSTDSAVNMKFFVLFVGAFALVQANRDWSEIKPLSISPLMPVLPEPGSRIVGGDEVKAHSRPYQVALFIQMKDRIAFCGGSLISPSYVLTAAHCVQPASRIEVVLGAHKIQEVEATQVRMNSTELKYHEEWSMFTLRNDIALIKLPRPVELNENIQLVKLPKRAEISNKFENEKVIASGWGKDTDKATAVSPVLREVHVPVMKNSVCKWFFFGVIQETHICTNSWGGHSTCSGDSGGPLVLETDGTQVGLVSFGISFGCELGWPAAYTRITSYIDWIEKNTDVKFQ